MCHRLFVTLAKERERFLEFGRQLQRQPDVSEVDPGVELRQYLSRWAFELWVEAIVRGYAVCWWFELSHDGTVWTIERRVTSGPDERTTALPDRSFPSVEALETSLSELASELLAVPPR